MWARFEALCLGSPPSFAQAILRGMVPGVVIGVLYHLVFR